MVQSKACFESAIQSEGKEKKREQRSRMSKPRFSRKGKCQVKEKREEAEKPNAFLFRSRHSVGSERTQSQNEQQQVEERRERDQRSRMHSVETLLRSHHSVGRESDTEGREKQAEKTDI
jgi:hypothetical protein